MRALLPLEQYLVLSQGQASKPLPNLKVWRGAFCIPNVFRDIPYGDGHRIWTPAYGCYDAPRRAQIRAAYVARGYTHFVYNCAGKPYRDDYPELADDAVRVERDLNELEADGIVPVVCATDDRQPLRVLNSFTLNGNRIKIAFPCWEQNGPLPSTADQKELIEKVHQSAPKADLYLHFTPGHGSISEDEPGGWHWCQSIGTVGLLAQGDNRFAAEPPDVGGRGLESTAIRLAGRVDLGAPASWAGLNQLTVKFEYGIKDIYDGGHVSEQQMADYTSVFLAHAPHVVGYCDGGK